MICSVDGCGKTAFRQSLCSSHNHRKQRYGDPLGVPAPIASEPLAWVEAHVSYDGPGCLPWPFAKAGRGYGQLTADGERGYAHRYICKRVNGPPPTPEHEASHTCTARARSDRISATSQSSSFAIAFISPLPCVPASTFLA